MACAPERTADGQSVPGRLLGCIVSETLSFAFDTFNSNKVRFALTALGMVIGTASLILVVTIGLTGKQYILKQIQGIGQTIKLSHLPFTVIGTFKERVETFGQSEVTQDTIVIPYTVSRYFTETPTVKQIYFTVSTPGDVPRVTAEAKRVIQARHRPE